MKYVIYYRVSTKRQGESGLGLEAQKRDIELFFEMYAPKNAEVLAEFTDVQSGMKDHRVEYIKAVELAKKEKAILLVAKLDRVSRRVSTIATLIEQVDLKVAVMPNADKFQLHIYAALAEQERDFISKRTKAALQVAKDNGVKLGGLKEKTDKRNQQKKAESIAFAEEHRDVVVEAIATVKKITLKAVGEYLDSKGLTTATGSNWGTTSVNNLLKTLEIDLKVEKLKRTI
ncbi:recombinase family protein [Vibrio sp. VNB-15]